MSWREFGVWIVLWFGDLVWVSCTYIWLNLELCFVWVLMFRVLLLGLWFGCLVVYV